MEFTKRQTEFVVLFLFGLDVVMLTLAALLAGALHPGANFTLATLSPFVSANAPYYFILFACWFLLGWSQGVFASTRRQSLLHHLYYVLRAVVLTLIVVYFIISFVQGTQPDTRFGIYFGLLMLVLVGGWRTVLMLGLWWLRTHGYNTRHVVLVGANTRSAALARLLNDQAQFGYRIIGALDDDPDRMRFLDNTGVPCLGKFDDAERILNTYVVDEFHVCLPIRSRYETIQSLADLCLGVGVSMRMVADLFPLQLARGRLHHLEGVPMLSLAMVSENGVQLALKRAIDLIGSVVLIIALSPLMLGVAVTIKATSPGPVFFAQERVGRNQRKFRMLKFRSMVVDAEAQRETLSQHNEVDGPIFKIRADPRVTPVGRFIRRYSIDELPQLFNVFRGEMSLVGPRPHPTKEVEQYTWHQRRRLSVKPGMTGLAQVSGRSDLTWQECVELDLGYIDSWNPFFDIWIMARTLRAVLSAEGAS